jgi:hypothetical protein
MNQYVFTAICDRLEDAVTELAWIDFDTGQLDLAGERPAVAFPAALVDITLPACNDTGGGEQDVTCNIQLRLAFLPAGNTNHLSPVREDALAIFNVVAKVHAALQGWATGELSELSRTSATTERRKDGLKVFRINYQTTFTEELYEEEEEEEEEE